MKKEEFLAMSLPYGLKGIVKGKENLCGSFIYKLYSCNCETNVVELVGETNFKTDKFKPILHPLSDLIKEIEHNGEKFIPLHKLLENSGFNLSKMTETEILNYKDVSINTDLLGIKDAMYLIGIHFDIFDLISKNEAIDVNTLNTNPYK